MNSQVAGTVDWWPYPWLWALALAFSLLLTAGTFFTVRDRSDAAHLRAEMIALPNQDAPPQNDAGHREVAPSLLVSGGHGVVARGGTETTVEHLTAVLADATAATIVGESETVRELLTIALSLKRSRVGHNSDAWSEINVVTLEPRGSRDQSETARSELARTYAVNRHSLRAFFLQNESADRWQVRTSVDDTATRGMAVEHADGRVSIVLTTQWRETLTHVIFEDSSTRSYWKLFQDISSSSSPDQETVVVARESPTGLVPSNLADRSHILRGRGPQNYTIPAVVVISLQERTGASQPLLQINFRTNSTREVSKISHPSGYLHPLDMDPSLSEVGERTTPFTNAEYVRAAQREISYLTSGGTEQVAFRLASVTPFYYHDNEQMSFAAVEARFPATSRFLPGAHLRAWSLDDLVNARLWQVLANAVSFVEANRGDLITLESGGRLVKANLAVHRVRVGSLNRTIKGDPDATEAFIRAARARQKDLEVARHHQSERVLITGLAGFQYREFYSVVLPAYIRANVPGASALFNTIDPRAVARLSALYRDQDFIQQLPQEL